MAGKRELRVTILGDASGAKRAFGEADRAASGFGNKVGQGALIVGRLGVAAASAGTIAAGAFGVKAVKAASDLNETMAKVEIVFGKSKDQVEEFANSMARGFGAPKREVLDAAAAIGLIGKASGLAQPQAAMMANQLAALALDASSFYNVPLPEALAAIQSGLVGEAEPMRRFGVLLSAQAVEAEAARLGLEKVNGAYTEGAKAQARASLIMAGMKDASGDLERTQDSLANRMKEVKGRVENFSASVGEKLLPKVLQAMDFMEKWAPIIQEKVGGAIEVARPFVERFGQVVGDVMLAASVVFTNIGQVVGDVFARVQEIIGRNEENFSTWHTRISEIVAAVAALFQPAMDLIRVEIEGAIAIISDLWDRFGRHLLDHIKTHFEAMAEVVKGALQAVKGVIDLIVGILTGDWSRAWGGIKDIFTGVVTAYQGIMKAAMNAVWAAIGAGMAVISAGWSLAWNGLKTAVSGVFEGIKQTVSSALDWVIDQIKKLPGRIVDASANIVPTVVKFITNPVGAAIDTARGKGDGPGNVGGKTLDRVRSMLGPGLYVTSTYRTPAQNRAAGGSPTSYHMDRNNPAVDIGGSTSALNSLAARLRAVGGWRELLWKVPGHYDHVHVAHEGGTVTAQGITPLRSDELLTKLQVGETVLPKGSGSANALLRSIVEAGAQVARTVGYYLDRLYTLLDERTMTLIGVGRESFDALKESTASMVEALRESARGISAGLPDGIGGSSGAGTDSAGGLNYGTTDDALPAGWVLGAHTSPDGNNGIPPGWYLQQIVGPGPNGQMGPTEYRLVAAGNYGMGRALKSNPGAYMLTAAESDRVLAEFRALPQNQRWEMLRTNQRWMPSGAREMATGGFVDRATHAIVGEAGPEIVSPIPMLRKVISEELAKANGGKHYTYNATAMEVVIDERRAMEMFRRMELLSI